MEKFVEVMARSNFNTTVLMRSELEKDVNLEAAVTYTMHRIKNLNTTDEKFELISITVVNPLKSKNYESKIGI